MKKYRTTFYFFIPRRTTKVRSLDLQVHSLCSTHPFNACKTLFVLLVVRMDWKQHRPGFLAKLKETHLVMFANNQNLKPKADELNSRPWMWPIAYRVSYHSHIFMIVCC